MDFETFKEKLARDVKEILEKRTGGEVTVEARPVDKMNESYEALTVKPKDSVIGVNLNATELFKAFESGKDYVTIAEGAADVAEKAIIDQSAFDVDAFTD